MSFMLEEIYQQPDEIARIVDSERATAAEVSKAFVDRGLEFGIIAARGTSDHAAIYGKYLMEIKNGIPVALADCSIFTLYEAKLKLDRALVVGVSQSGQAPDVSEYLEEARKAGALTLAITNEPGSGITEIAHHTLYCRAGKEKAVAATKTYTSTLACFYLLSASLCGDCLSVDSLLATADAIRGVLQTDEQIAYKAERYRFMSEGYFVGRGLNYCTAREAALKLEETNYIGVNSFSAADFMHGPIAAVHEGDPCFLFIPPGKAFDSMVEIAGILRARGAETVVFSSDKQALKSAKTAFEVPVTVEEELSPLIYIIPAQLFAYHLARARGYNPDHPRGLTKVTLTR